MVAHVIIVSAQSKELGFWVFSCKDAAQQVLMSVCPSVCLSSNLKFFHIMQSLQFQNVLDCSKMFQNAYRMFQNVPECMQNVPECMQNVQECMQNVQECMQNVPKCMQIHELASRLMSLHAG